MIRIFKGKRRRHERGGGSFTQKRPGERRRFLVGNQIVEQEKRGELSKGGRATTIKQSVKKRTRGGKKTNEQENANFARKKRT